MDVAANDALSSFIGGKANHGFLKAADEVHHILDATFHIRAEGPVRVAKESSAEIDRCVEVEQKLVSDVTHMGQPTHILHYSIEFMTVNHKQSATLQRCVDGTGLDMHVGVVACKIGDPFVVVAGYVNDL